ncbi:uncharacterized protein LOC130758375 [Actinidia eriantha]|uniref:uncharacterized protein LOC130758375 n=1 Tax=Actinidia eriantha TaxID=165200 RepID=UPI00258D7A1A|nr:uncharacterized protein LOC130758375 [Actinidia eriantha]
MTQPHLQFFIPICLSTTALMASSKPAIAKQLGELLQEQQEPFILEIYLLERGYLKNVNPNTGSRCCSSISSSFLKSSAGLGLSRRRKVIPNCSKIVKAVFNKLVSVSSNQKLKNSASGKGNFSVWDQEKAESDRFSSASSTTVFNSCSESDAEDGVSATEDSCLASKLAILNEKKRWLQRKLQWRSREEDSKELSSVSVLEDIPSNEDSPRHDNRQRNAKTRDSIHAVSFSKFIFQTSVDEPKGYDHSSQYVIDRRALQQSKQPLFDCVRELVGTGGWKNGRRQQSVEFPGAEELVKLLYEDIRTWSKLSGNETNTTHMLNSNFMAPVGEWSDFETQTREISAEIGDAILEDISKAIVVDMTAFVEQHLCEAR